MKTIDSLQDKAMQVASQIGDGIRNVPDHAQKWFRAGVAVGTARAGRHALTNSARRHPVISATAAAAVMAAAAGLAVYAFRRRKEQERGSLEGRARRVDARRHAPAQREPVGDQASRGAGEGHAGDGAAD